MMSGAGVIRRDETPFCQTGEICHVADAPTGVETYVYD
jgi:hypothetical protein